MARTIDKYLQNIRKAQILDAAAECFVENGFHQTGMKQICTQSGLSAGSVYHYFENKDAIIEGIATEFNIDTALFFKTIEKSKDFVVGLKMATKKRLKETKKHIRYGRLVVEIYAESFRNEKVKKIIQLQDDDAVDKMAMLIKHAMSNKQISSNFDATILAHLLIAIIDGLENRILQNTNIKLAKLSEYFELLIAQLFQVE